MIINLSPELEARVSKWSNEFHRPCEDLAVELLEEYFEDSETGARIAEAVENGETEVFSWDEVKNGLYAMEN